MGMKFSIFYFADGAEARDEGLYRLLIDGARFADENGFEAVWTPERHFHAFGGPYANPSVTGAAIAAVTTRVRIRAGSVVAPLHHPLRIAEEWSMVDNLSGGRVGIAFAPGWNPVDFAFSPQAYDTRARVVAETVEQVRSFWAGEPAAVVDGKGQTRQVLLHPRPVQKELPIWLTSGGSRQTFESAGRLGTGLLTHLFDQDIDELAEKIALYRRAAKESSTEPNVVVMLHTLLGNSREEVRSLVRAPMKEYLRSSLDLMSRTSLVDEDLDPALLEELMDEVLERAFERYFAHGALFGTVEDGRQRIEELRAAGVDEVACLIDFGLPDSTVLHGLRHLRDLKQSCDE
ncbi:MupA/Atu3671 family FMN-dependent luciferase-like monooxygenase [Micromonospora sp. NPDC000663]|uniref:MupA/Atu3671 family FMN-dependent luciferase-like monooxygenase n=1 Tax=Micromonospora sp. NPDC000663 TaxID=3364218 RepID=UPI0036D0A856